MKYEYDHWFVEAATFEDQRWVEDIRDWKVRYDLEGVCKSLNMAGDQGWQVISMEPVHEYARGKSESGWSALPLGIRG